MNIDDNNKYTLIDKYLKGGMSSQELDSFRAFLQSDKDFATDLNIVSELNEATAFHPQEQQLRDTLSTIHTSHTSSGAQNSSENTAAKYTKMAIAALLFCLLMYSAFKFINPTKQENTTFDLAQYAMVEPLLMTTKSASSGFDISEMQSLYNEGDYAGSLEIIDAYLLVHPEDLDVLLANGIALSKTGNYTSAHTVFNHIKTLEPRVKKFMWYDALAYVKEGNIVKAKGLLTQIVATKSYNYPQASELLQNLK